jgi:hypothetical protein
MQDGELIEGPMTLSSLGFSLLWIAANKSQNQIGHKHSTLIDEKIEIIIRVMRLDLESEYRLFQEAVHSHLFRPRLWFPVLKTLSENDDS